MRHSFFFVCAALAFMFSSCTEESLPTESSAKNLQVSFSSTPTPTAYVSSNTTGTIGIYDVSNKSAVDDNATFRSVPYVDADGIIFDSRSATAYQVDRSDNRLVAYAGITKRRGGSSLYPSAIGPANFSNGREATMSGNTVVVADDVTPGILYTYEAYPTEIAGDRWYNTGIELWGIQATGNDLWAIEDVSSNLVYYADFFDMPSGTISHTAKVSIEGLVRTHGLNYDAEADVMVLTDIGSAGSATDGGLIVIENFSSVFAQAGDGGTIMMSDQIRIYGDNTELGNPVDVAVNVADNAIYVAERAQGKFLIFDYPTMNCNCAPAVSSEFPGASAVTITRDRN